MGTESQALGRVAAIVENRIPDLSPIRVARLCDDPRSELAVLLRAYRTKPQDEGLERRMEEAFFPHRRGRATGPDRRDRVLVGLLRRAGRAPEDCRGRLSARIPPTLPRAGRKNDAERR